MAFHDSLGRLENWDTMTKESFYFYSAQDLRKIVLQWYVGKAASSYCRPGIKQIPNSKTRFLLP